MLLSVVAEDLFPGSKIVLNYRIRGNNSAPEGDDSQKKFMKST